VQNISSYLIHNIANLQSNFFINPRVTFLIFSQVCENLFLFIKLGFYGMHCHDLWIYNSNRISDYFHRFIFLFTQLPLILKQRSLVKNLPTPLNNLSNGSIFILYHNLCLLLTRRTNIIKITYTADTLTANRYFLPMLVQKRNPAKTQLSVLFTKCFLFFFQCWPVSSNGTHFHYNFLIINDNWQVSNYLHNFFLLTHNL